MFACLRIPSVIVRCSLAAAVAAVAAAASPVQAATLAGLNVGEKAPGFELKDQSGASVKLDTLLQAGPVAVVFYRSADWCPFCQKQLVDLQAGLVEIRAAGLQLVAISYDPVEVLERFAKKRSIQFPLLSDPGSTTIKNWKLLNADANGGTAGIPHPMTYVVSRDGVIRIKLGHETYQARHTVSELIHSTKTLNEP